MSIKIDKRKLHVNHDLNKRSVKTNPQPGDIISTNECNIVVI